MDCYAFCIEQHQNQHDAPYSGKTVFFKADVPGGYLIYAVIYIGNIFSRFRRLSFRGMLSVAGPVIIYGLMPVVLILCGIALIGLKKDK